MPSIPTLLLASAKRRRRVPEAPTITGITSSNVGELEVAFTAPNDPTEGSSPVTNYEYSVDDGSTWTTKSPASTSSPITITGLTLGATYTVRIRAVNEAGFGPQSNSSTGTALGYNVASGGSVSTINNYLGTGETWRVHTFTSGGTFSVTTSTFPFKVLAVGGGGRGGDPTGNVAQATGGGGGGAGGVREQNVSIPAGSHSVTVGGQGGSSGVYTFSASGGGGGGGGINGGGGGNGGSGGGQAGFGDGSGVPPTGGPGSGSLGQGTNGQGNSGRTGGRGGGAGSGSSTSHTASGRSSSITGSSYTYAIGGGSDGNGGSSSNYGSGGQGVKNNSLNTASGGSGRSGIVVIAYRTG